MGSIKLVSAFKNLMRFSVHSYRVIFFPLTGIFPGFLHHGSRVALRFMFLSFPYAFCPHYAVLKLPGPFGGKERGKQCLQEEFVSPPIRTQEVPVWRLVDD